MLSIVAGMVDLTGFYTLGNVFTAHVTGNLVVVTAALVAGEPVRWAQAVAIPIFMLAVAAVWLTARSSARQSAGLVRLLLIVQFALMRLAMPHAISTAVMTGNLTNFVLSSMDLLSGSPSRSVGDKHRWVQSALLLGGFLGGCGIAAVAVRMLADWAWVGPVALAAVLALVFA
jgi:uncharacterized membrane protein YoaK (UPF0700 family)